MRERLIEALLGIRSVVFNDETEGKGDVQHQENRYISIQSLDDRLYSYVRIF
jgi:hypothetical protein